MDLQTTLLSLRREDDLIAVVCTRTPMDGTIVQRSRGMWTVIMPGLIKTAIPCPIASTRPRYPGRFYRL